MTGTDRPAGVGSPSLAPPRDRPPIVPLSELSRADLPLAGGKGANLGELLRAGFRVPDGFCVATPAYEQMAEAAGLAPLLEGASPDDLAARARQALLDAPLPDALASAIRAAYRELGAGELLAVAVRSSATAEDLPEASFAGQQDTYLDVVGEEALLDAVRRCWASLWTDRAVSYRRANGIEDRDVLLAVVVQRMVPAASAGVLFTANPLTGNRRQAVIDAVPGLGERLVSGAANPDHFVVDAGGQRIVERTPAGAEGDGAPAACLDDEQVLELARVGREVEAHFGTPQDVEWAFDRDGQLWLVQSRPVTTLFPLPAEARPEADDLQVYFSFNVAQGVLGPLTPMGINALRRLPGSLARSAGFAVDAFDGPTGMVEAGNRLYLKVTPLLRHPLGRRLLLGLLGLAEPRTAGLLRGLLDDPRLAAGSARLSPGVALRLARLFRRAGLPVAAFAALLRPATTRERRLRAARQIIGSPEQGATSPVAALDRTEQILDRTHLALLQVLPVAAAGIASFGLAHRLSASLGAGDEALLVSRGLPHNPTTEMNLALWDLATRLRADPAVVDLLTRLAPADAAARCQRGELPPLVQREVGAFLRQYGFRGVAEIDLGLPRWRDDPTPLFSVLSSYLQLDDPDHAPNVQFRRGAAEAVAAMASLVRRARASGLLGPARAALLGLFFDRTRQLAGVREMPKFLVVSALGECRALLWQVGTELTEQGRLERADDVFFLYLAEAHRALAGADLRSVARSRRDQYGREQRRKLVPRVLLSDGTALYGAEAAMFDGQRLVGTPASPGVYRGRARVVLDPRSAHLEPGEVLVAPSTDPGWTPLFLAAGALVMEMGGMMSHGAVVAREYGIPAVVGALGATTAIDTGQEVVVDGGRGEVSLESAREPGAEPVGKR